MKIQNTPAFGLASILIALLFLFHPSHAQDNGRPVTERIGAATDQAKNSLQDGGSAAVNKIEQIWQRVDERRLKNRTRDELVGWVLMGLLVGAVAGLASVLRTSVPQRVGAVILGLIGSFVGGIVAHVAQLDFGMGPVLIRYEDLLLSIAGGLVLILAVRFFKARRKGKI